MSNCTAEEAISTISTNHAVGFHLWPLADLWYTVTVMPELARESASQNPIFGREADRDCLMWIKMCLVSSPLSMMSRVQPVTQRLPLAEASRRPAEGRVMFSPVGGTSMFRVNGYRFVKGHTNCLDPLMHLYPISVG